jgi:hypothetical protein
MNETDCYHFLEKRFVDTFLDELMPGIFHNFANPVNGIMGRSKLMQRRLEEIIGKIENRYPDFGKESGADFRKLLSDISAINDASDELYDLFRAASGKFYALGAREVESVNLSALIGAELGFSEFYLDFKHNIKKEVHLDKDVPSVTGVTAHYSIAFWLLIFEAAKNVQKRNNEALRVATTSDDRYVIVSISHIGDSLVQGWRGIVFPAGVAPDPLACGSDEEKNLICALTLIRLAGSDVEMTLDRDAGIFTIRIPYHR